MDKVTTDHNVIKKWVERHNGKPQIIDHPTAEGDKPGIRIQFPAIRDDTELSDDTMPRDISWDEFFKIFDEEGLELEYRDQIPADYPSDAYRFLRR